MSKLNIGGEKKNALHSRNVSRDGYPFAELISLYPELKHYTVINPVGQISLDFFNPKAVRVFNAILLDYYHQIKYFSLPEGYLCPPVPGRADYIHYVADLLAETYGRTPHGSHFHMLDMGTGASAVFGLLAAAIYRWKCTMADVDQKALDSASAIWRHNESVLSAGDFRHQTHSHLFFEKIIRPDDFFDVVVCNPPFHSSEAEAKLRADKKFTSLKKSKREKTVLNFGGTSGELWYPGGEATFIKGMMAESIRFGNQCYWFTTLVSRQSTLPVIYNVLDEVRARKVKTIDMGQGNKRSRIVCWTFFTPEQEKAWQKMKMSVKQGV